MVNSVSNYGNYAAGFYRAAAGTAVLHQNDIENMIRFSNGMPIATSAEPSIMDSAVGTLPYLGIFGGIQGISTLKNNGLVGAKLAQFENLKKQGLAKGWSWAETVKNVNSRIPYTTRGESLKAGIETVKNQYGNIFKKSVAVSTERGFVGKILDKIPGYTKLRSTGFGQAMGKSGAGWMTVIDGTMETFTNVVPTFQQLGAGAGFKQLGKSAVKVAAGAGGWLAGDAVGKGIGAAIGTAICPGIGTAIGTFLGGFIGGIVGSAAAGKVAKAVTGKSELEKAQDKQISEISQQAGADEATKIALAQQTLQQANTVLAEDAKNKDALMAKTSAEKVLSESITTQQTPETAVQQETMPQMQGNIATPQTMTFPGAPVVPGFNGFGYDMNIYSQAMSQANVNPMAYNAAAYTTQQYTMAQNPFIPATQQATTQTI